MHTVYYSTGSSIFNIRTVAVVLILVYITITVTITGNILRSRVVATTLCKHLSLNLSAHNSKYNNRDIRSTCITSTTRRQATHFLTQRTFSLYTVLHMIII